MGSAEFRRKIVNLIPWPRLHHARDMIDLMHDTSVEIYEGKKKAFRDGDEAAAKQVDLGKDIMGILSSWMMAIASPTCG